MTKLIALSALMAGLPTCVQSVRGEADPKALFAELQTTVQALRDEHANSLKAKADDVVTTEKIDKINAKVSELQASLDDVARKAAAAELNGAGGRTIADPEYTTAFNSFARSGEVQASLSKSTGADGGYLAPVEWDRTITDKLIELSPMRSLCSVQTIGTAGFKKLFNLRGTVSGWVGETAARPETATPTFGELTYSPGEIYANAYITQQMLDDSEIDLEAFIAGEFTTEFAKQEGTAFVAGTGVNRPNGFLNYVLGGTAAGVHPLGNIPIINSGHASQVQADGLVKLIYDLPSVFRGNAGFVMNRATEGLVRLLKDTSGQFLWQPSLQLGKPATLLGYSVTEVGDMPNTAANALALAFGDFRQGYQIVERTSLGILRDPYTQTPHVRFYGTKRVGGGLLNPEALRIQRIAA